MIERLLQRCAILLFIKPIPCKCLGFGFFLFSFSITSNSYANAHLVNLPLDEGSGVIADDISGNGNHGILEGGSVFEANSGDGSLYSVRFDGVDDFITLGPLDVSGSGLTLAAWFNADSFPGPSADPRIISKASGTASSAHIFMLGPILVGSQMRLRARVRIGGTTTTLIADSGNIFTNVWHHAAMTYDGVTLRLYLDGVEAGSTPLSGTVDTDPGMPVTVGSQPPGAGARFFDGLLDDIQIIQRALSTAEIAAIINGNNQSPLASNDDYTASEDTTLIVDAASGILANDTDGDLDNLQAILASDVSNGALNLRTDGSFDYTPAAGFSGTDSFSYYAHDGFAASNVATVSLAILGVNDIPVAVDDNYQTLPDTTLFVAAAGVLSNDTDADLDPLQAVLLSEVMNGTLSFSANGSFSYSPNTGFTGTDSFSYVANDGQADSNPATVSISIKIPPSAVDDNYTTDEDVVLTVPAASGILNNDTDNNPPYDLSAVLITYPSNGILSGFTSDGGFSYAPNADFNGSDSFTYEVVDAASGTRSQATVTFTVNAVNDVPIAVGDLAVTGMDTAVEIDVLANDSDIDGVLDTATILITTLPVSGSVSVNGVAGVISYSPTAGFIGSDSFSYTVQDDAGATSNHATVNIEVAGSNLDILVHLPLEEGGGLVAGDISGNGNHGTLVGGPVFEANSADGSSFSVRFDGVDDSINLGALDVDGSGLTLAAWFNADSFPGPSGDPRIVSKASGTASTEHVFMLSTIQVGSQIRLRARIRIGGNTTTLIAAAGDLVTGVWQHAALTYDGTAMRLYLDGVEVGSTPLSGQVDMDPNLSVAIGSQPPSAGVRHFDGLLDDIRILPRALDAAELAAIVSNTGNIPPMAVNDGYGTAEDTVLVIAAAEGVLANDTDGNLDSLQAVLVSNVSNGTLGFNTDGSFSYVPSSDFNGTDSFSYRANDGRDSSNIATVTLSVTGVNDAPIAVNDNYISTPDTALVVDVTAGLLANDSDADLDSLQTILQSDVVNGTLSLNPDGSFSYTPASGFSGTDSFIYTAHDGTVASNPASVVVTVAPPPISVDDNYSTDEDASLTRTAVVGVLVNDTDNNPPDDLTAILISVPTNGSVSSFNADGSFTYVPNPDFNGLDSFTYEIVDGGNGGRSQAMVHITVNAVNDAPLAMDDTLMTQINTARVINISGELLANDLDVDQDALVLASFSQPAAGGSITDNMDGTLAYIPAPSFEGIDTFTYTATDGQTISNTAVTSIIVNPVSNSNQPPRIITGGVGFFKKIVDATLEETHKAVAADLNGDNNIDIVATDFVNDSVFWYESDGNGGFIRRVLDNNLDGAYPVSVEDLEGDGDIDVFATGYNANTVVWYENNGSGSFNRRNVDVTANGAHSVIARDVDQDGDKDLLTTNQDGNMVNWYENDGSNNFSPITIDSAATGAKMADLADLDKDGDQDVVAASFFRNEVAWYENNGSQSFNKHVIDSNAKGSYYVAVADMNGDAHIDVLAANRLADTITLYWNNGSGSFSLQYIDTTADGARTVITADVDRDGDQDIISAAVNNDFVAWYQNNDGQFERKAVDFNADGAYGVSTIDMDHDGDVDILSASRDAFAVAVHYQIKKHQALVDFGGALTIDTGLLQTLDNDDGPVELTYMITAEPKFGELLLDGVALTNGATFTQAEVDSNRLSYMHGGTDTVPDVFTFKVADGGEFGVGAAAGDFTLYINDSNAAQQVLVNLPINEGSGLVAADISGKNNHGSLVNGPSYEANTGDGSAFALRFDGVDDYVDLGSLDVNGTGLTLAARFNADSFSISDQRLISKGTSTAANDHIFMLSHIRIDGVIRLRVRVRVGGNTTTLIATTGNIVAGVWYQVTATYDGATLRLYLDGEEVGNTPLSGPVDIDPSIPVIVGSQPPGAGGKYFDGLIDDVRVIQRALTPLEVKAVFFGTQ